MHIDINTKFIMLIGQPLSQSFAARMQNVGYKAAGMNMRYFYNEADSTHLREILDGIRHMPAFAGAAITRPNKVAVMQYLDELDPLCRKMGACNTVVKREDGRLIGYNTDGEGFLTCITRDAGFSVQDKTFFIIGAGGAGRSMTSALAYAGAKCVYVTDIVDLSAASLVADVNTNFPPVARQVPFGDFACAAECDSIMNASGIGMGAARGKSPLPAKFIQPHHFCFDACYNPEKTQFLLDAEAKGCATLNGLGMSLYQGAEQIVLWTGQDAPLDVMRAELEKIGTELNAAHRQAEAPAATQAALAALEAAGATTVPGMFLQEGN
ncbi:MAG: shikimate dehydrogenase [Coriobacteriia bacterium]|nr:shikimate dehydrogenase [Coriobacteriia bacterium]